MTLKTCMLSSSIKKTSVTSDEGTISIAGKQRKANLNVSFFSRSFIMTISFTIRITRCVRWKQQHVTVALGNADPKAFIGTPLKSSSILSEAKNSFYFIQHAIIHYLNLVLYKAVIGGRIYATSEFEIYCVQLKNMYCVQMCVLICPVIKGLTDYLSAWSTIQWLNVSD